MYSTISVLCNCKRALSRKPTGHRDSPYGYRATGLYGYRPTGPQAYMAIGPQGHRPIWL